MKASFVIPSHNAATWLAHAVLSAQKQNYADLEIVVVDDGSTDSTPKLMEFMAKNDSRIKYLRLDKNVGRSEARNIGNRAATGDFILVLDADDVAYPDRAKLTAAKIKAGASFVHGSCDFIDAISDVFNLDRAVKEKVNRIVHSTVAYTKYVAFNNEYLCGEPAKLGLDDWEFQLRLATQGVKFDNITPVVGAYRDIESGISKHRDENAVLAFKTAYLEAMKVPA